VPNLGLLQSMSPGGDGISCPWKDNGYPSERDIKGLFADFDTTSNHLGNTVKGKNTRLAAVLKGVAEIEGEAA